MLGLAQEEATLLSSVNCDVCNITTATTTEITQRRQQERVRSMMLNRECRRTQEKRRPVAILYKHNSKTD